MSPLDLFEKIDIFREIVEDFGTSNYNSRDAWQIRKEIYEDFKGCYFREISERQEAWEDFQSISEVLKEKQSAINKENEKFAEEAKQLVLKIKDALSTGLFNKELDRNDFHEINSDIRSTFEFLKLNRWPSNETKTNTWDTFNDLREKFKEKQDSFFEQRRNEHKRRIEHSNELTTKILNALEGCYPDSPLDELLRDVEIVIWFLTGLGFAELFLKWIFGIKEKPEHPLKVKGKALRDLRQFTVDNKNDIKREDQIKIFEKLNDVQDKLNEAWDEHKKDLRNKQEERERRIKENEQKRGKWLGDMEDKLKRHENRLENQKVFKEKLAGFKDKQENFLSKLESRLENQQAYLRKVNSELDDLDDKYEDARSDSFRDRVSGWIEEKKSKISEVEDDIGNIERKIKEVKESIEGLCEKIDTVERDIEELVKKIEELRNRL